MHTEKDHLSLDMEAKEPIVKLINALQEIGLPVSRQLLLDYITGRRTREIEELELYDRDTYGIGESNEDDYWSTIIDAAYEAGLLKQMATKNNDLAVTATGKKFAKKPTSIIIPDDEPNSDGVSGSGDIDSLLEQAQKERLTGNNTASSHTKLQIKLITAIDRHIALDDFAEQEGLGLDEVLDDLETLVRQKRRIDISYFTNEVLGSDCMQELLEYFEQAKNDSLDTAMEEYDGIYSEEEIRLARVVYRAACL